MLELNGIGSLLFRDSGTTPFAQRPLSSAPADRIGGNKKKKAKKKKKKKSRSGSTVRGTYAEDDNGSTYRDIPAGDEPGMPPPRAWLGPTFWVASFLFS